MHRPGLSYTFQVEWIRGRGLLLWMAMVLGAIGGGAFLVSTVVDFHLGSLFGFFIATFGKGSFHLAFLGRPARFWRALRRPHSSWLSRGTLILILFGLLGLLYLILLWNGTPAPDLQVVRWAAIVCAVLLITYDGFLMAAAPGVAFWNSSVLPVLYGAAALLGGVGITLAILTYLPDVVEPTRREIETLERYVLLALASLILSYLWTAYYTTSGARQSVRELVRGQLLGLFLFMVLVAIVVPAGASLLSFNVPLPRFVLAAAAVFAVAGDFGLKYTILRAGLYAPLLPRFVAAGGSPWDR